MRAKLKMFIPCIEGRCPERMQLKGYLEGKPIYQCERRQGEKYSLDCYYHEHPYPAGELNAARWIRDGEKWQPRLENGDKPTEKDLETMV